MKTTPIHLAHKWLTLIICLTLVLVTAAVYWPVLNNDFIKLDDHQYLLENPNVQNGLTWASVKWSFQAGYASNWHPLTWLSHLLDIQLSGFNPGWHHGVNLLLHLANTVLLFLILWRMTAAAWRSAFVAALFAVHPLHVESVAWVAERKDVLCGFFFMLALGAYARYVERRGQRTEDGRWETGKSGKRKAETGKTKRGSGISNKNAPPLHEPDSGTGVSPVRTGTHGRDAHATTAAPAGSGGQSAKGLSAPPLPAPLLHPMEEREKKGASGKWVYYWLALGLFALGLMSKPMLVTFPCLLLLLDVWPLQRVELKNGTQAFKKFRPLVWEKIPFFLLGAASSWVTYFAQNKGHSVSALETLPLDYRLANVAASYWKYLGKTLWPTKLVVFYPYPTGHDGLPGQWEDWQITLAALLLVGVSLLAFGRIKRTPWLAVGWFWFLGMLVPVIGIVQVGAQSMADRYTYLPLIGIFICFTWGIAGFFSKQRLGKNMLIFAAASVIAACAATTHRQAQLWRNSFTLFSHALEVDPNNAVAHDIVGQEFWKQGQHQMAKEHFLAAMQSNPQYEDARHDFAVTATQSGAALAMQGKLAEAVDEFQAALKVKPSPQTYNALGLALWQLDRHAEALEQYAEALRLQPNDAAAHENLGQLYLGEGQLNEAATQFEEVLQLRPDAPAHHNLGIIRATQGKVEAAIPHFTEAVRLQPDSAVALNDLAWVLATALNPELRAGTRAVELANQACKLTNEQQPLYLGTLAAAYAEAGRFPEAVATAEKARDLANRMGWTGVGARNEQLLELYRADKAFHESEER